MRAPSALKAAHQTVDVWPVGPAVCVCVFGCVEGVGFCVWLATGEGREGKEGVHGNKPAAATTHATNNPNRTGRRGRTRQRLRALPLVSARRRPQLDAVVVRAAREQLAAGVPRDALDVTRVSRLDVEALELVAGGVLPQPHRLVAAARGQGAASGRPGGALNLGLVALERRDLFGARCCYCCCFVFGLEFAV